MTNPTQLWKTAMGARQGRATEGITYSKDTKVLIMWKREQDLTNLFGWMIQSLRESKDIVLEAAETLNLLIAPSLNNGKEDDNSDPFNRLQEVGFCCYLQTILPNVRCLNVGLADCDDNGLLVFPRTVENHDEGGSMFSSRMLSSSAKQSSFPVQGVFVLLHAFPKLTSLHLEELQLLPSSTSTTCCDPDKLAGEACSELAMYLRDNETLLQISIRRCSLGTPSATPPVLSLDPLFRALQTIPTLTKIFLELKARTKMHPWESNLLTMASHLPRLRVAEASCCGMSYVFRNSWRIPQIIPHHGPGATLRLHVGLPTSPDQAAETGRTMSSIVARSNEVETPKKIILDLSWRLASGDKREWRYDNRQHLDSDILRQRMKALQSFLDAFASGLAAGRAVGLQALQLHCRQVPYNQTALPMVSLSSQSFVPVLETTPTLTSLSLPLCGELEGPLPFLLQVNASKIPSLSPEPKSLIATKKRLEEVFTIGCTSGDYSEEMGLSLLYYALRKNPWMLTSMGASLRPC